MKPLSKSLRALCFTSALLVPLTAKCDIFVMKDGTRLKGKIIEQTYEFYSLKVEIAENILGDKKVRVKDVVKIIRDDSSEKDYQRIKKLFPTSDFLKLQDYEKIKKDYFNNFYTAHPRSKYTEEVKELQKKVDEEYKILKNGGAKIDGELLTKDHIQANKYEVEAIILLRKLERDFEKKRYISMLRNFEILEANYTHTRPFPKALGVVKKLLPSFINDLNKLSTNVEKEIAKKEKYINRLPSVEQKRIINLLEKDDADYQASLLNAKERLKTKWLPLNKYQKEPIDSVIKTAITEQQRYEKFSLEKYQDGGKLYRDILKSIYDKDFDTGSKQLDAFKQLHPPESYLNMLKVEILAIKDAAQARKERERQAEQEATKAKAIEKAAQMKAEREAKKNKKKGTTEDKVKKKLNIKSKEDLLKEIEKETK